MLAFSGSSWAQRLPLPSPYPSPTPRQPDITRWRKEIIDLPLEALQTTPYSDETLKLARELRDLCKTHQSELAKAVDANFAWRDRNNELHLRQKPEEPPPYMVHPPEPVMQALERLVFRPDYTLEVFADIDPVNEWGDLPIPEARWIKEILLASRLQMYELARSREHQKHARRAETLLRSLKISPFAPLECMLSAMEGLAIFSGYPRLHLRREAPIMDEVTPKGRGMRESFVPHYESIGALRSYKRRGIPVKIEIFTSMGLASAVWTAKAKYLETYVLPGAKDMSEITGIKDKINYNERIAKELRRTGKPTDLQIALHAASVRLDLDSLAMRATVSLVKIDQLRKSMKLATPTPQPTVPVPLVTPDIIP